MADGRRALDLAERAIELAGGESEAIVVVSGGGLTRFTHNAIHQNLATDDVTVRVRTIVDGRTGVATTHDPSDAGMRAAIERARALAEIAPHDERAALTASPSVPSPSGAYDDATARFAPTERAELAATMFDIAERDGLWLAGYVATDVTTTAIANARGTRASHRGTHFAANVKSNGADSTGYAEFYGNAASAFDVDRTARVACDKAKASAMPGTVEPGDWTVILEPAAFGELLSYLAPHFSAQSYDEGSSFLSGALGETFAAENVTVRDDHAHPLLDGRPFDDEGVPTQRVALIERGVGRGIVTDARYARILDRPNTGHALPEPNPSGPRVGSLVVDPGTSSLEALVAGTERGLLVTRFWYIRPVDARRTIVTGMTRDGTFLIEDGKIASGVRNLRFNQSIIGALGDAAFSDRQVRTAGYSYASVVPAAKLGRFHFSSDTAF